MHRSRSNRNWRYCTVNEYPAQWRNWPFDLGRDAWLHPEEEEEETYRDRRRCRDWTECNISDSLYKWYVNKQCDGFEKYWRNTALICRHHSLCVAIRLSRKRRSCSVSNSKVQYEAVWTRRLARWRRCSVQAHRRQSENKWVREEEKLEDEKIDVIIRDRVRVYQVWRRCGRARVDSRRGNRDHGAKVYSSFDHLKMKRRKEKQTALSLDEDSYLNDPEWHLTDKKNRRVADDLCSRIWHPLSSQANQDRESVCPCNEYSAIKLRMCVYCLIIDSCFFSSACVSVLLTYLELSFVKNVWLARNWR